MPIITQCVNTCKSIVNIAGKRSNVRDAGYVFLIVKDCLVKMSDAPSLRDVEVKEACQIRCGLSRHRILPCTEWHKEIPFRIKCQIPVHHC